MPHLIATCSPDLLEAVPPRTLLPRLAAALRTLGVYTLGNLRSHVDCGESFTPSGAPFVHLTLEAKKRSPEIRAATAETLMRELEAILREYGLDHALCSVNVRDLDEAYQNRTPHSARS